MTTSIEELQRWLSAQREGEHLEFKEAKRQYDPMKLYRYCVALANEGGGKMILGITDKRPRKVAGTAAFADIADIASKIFIKLRFRVDVEEVIHPDGRVLVFHIPSRPAGTAYNFEGAYLMRSTEDTVAMSEDRLRQIFDEGKPNWLMQPACATCGSDEVIRLVDIQAYFDLLKLPLPVDRRGILDRLEKESLIKCSGTEWTITNLGAVLFAKKLDEFEGLQRKAPRVIVYKGSGKQDTRVDKSFQKGYAVGFVEILDFINAQIPTNEVIGRALRQEVKMFPELAVRELVANALIHQDFTITGTTVMVEIYSDRLEISNPGKPFIPPDRFIDEYQTRNDLLADLMRRIGICEEKGSGIDKVVNAAEVYQLPAPDFRISDQHTKAILYAHKDFEDMDRKDRIRACYQHCALRYVMNQDMTNQTMRERFSLSAKRAESVSRIIRDSIKEKVIKLKDPSATSLRYRRYLPYWA